MKQCACLFIHRTAVLVFLVLSACQPPQPVASTTLPAPHAAVNTATSSPIPILRFTPPATPTIEELIFPYTIDGLRQHDFKSGSVHIRSILDENDHYTSYLID